MSILDITSDNFNISVGDVSKEIEIQAYTTYEGKDNISWMESRNHQNNARHVQVIMTNRITKALNKLVPGWPTSRQVRDVVEEVLGKKVTCKIQKYTGRNLKNTVSYHLGERGEKGPSYQRTHGTIYRGEYKGTKAEVRFTRIDIKY